MLYLRWLQPFIKLPKSRLGSRYGSWTVPNGFLTPQSVCYTAGAGEDISFDLALNATFGCEVHIFDPTPRALAHFNALKNSLSNNSSFATPTGYQYPKPEPHGFSLKFHDLGLWDKPDTLRFFAPKDEKHVSYSALNLQKTNDYFEAKVDAIEHIMRELGHSKISLLKMDIEGAEYRVIDSILRENIDIDVLCIEFDESHTPLDGKFHKRITQSLNKLKKAGYRIFDIDSTFNYSLISEKALSHIATGRKQ